MARRSRFPSRLAYPAEDPALLGVPDRHLGMLCPSAPPAVGDSAVPAAGCAMLAAWLATVLGSARPGW